MKFHLIFGVFLSILTFGHVQAGLEEKELETVESVDLERYMGDWFEVARMPAFFQQGCKYSKAQYQLLDDGTVEVKNSCRLWWKKGPKVSLKGVARVVSEDESNSKLKVKFQLGRRDGDYWIIELDADQYQWAVVGEPNRKRGWILSRAQNMDQDLYEDLVQRMKVKHGYDVSKLIPSMD